MSKHRHERDTEAIIDEQKTANAGELAADSAGSGPGDVRIEMTDPGERTDDGEPDSAAESVPDTEDEFVKRIAELERENAELRDAVLRKTADFENYRKRMLREKEEFASYANRELLLDIVGIVDDFERAIRSADESQDFTAFHDGIVMIEKQFTGMLERKWKLSRFESAGDEFDPQRHEAMMTEERSDYDHSVVLEDFQKGYMLHGKVLRPAKVKVSVPTDTSSADDE